jgi:hypothetical protein
LRRNVFSIIYIIIVVSSLLLLSVETANYFQFYSALLSIQTTPESQQVINDLQQNTTSILLQFRVTNPTSYSGLKIQWVNLALDFTIGNSTYLDSLNLRSPNPLNTPIGPMGTVHVKAAFQIQGDNYKAFNAFYNQYHGAANASYTVDVHLDTWLQAFTGIDVNRGFQYPLQ